MITLSQDQIQSKIDFIKNYGAQLNASTASEVDPNANITSKNVATLIAELHKDENVQIKRAIIKQKLTELYDEDIAKEYERQILNHEIYVHDESHPVMPYTYSASEVVIAKIDNESKLISFSDLYALSNADEFLEDEDKNVWCKYPTNIEVLDKGNVWTKVTRLVKKERHRDLVRIKTAFGEDLVVTDNHPLIISDDKTDTIDAINSLNQNQLRLDYKIEFKGQTELDLSKVSPYTLEVYDGFYTSKSSDYNASVKSVKNPIKLDRTFGYFVGFFIGDGHYNHKDNEFNTVISFTQRDKEVLKNLAKIAYDYTGATPRIYYKGDKTNCWVLNIKSQDLLYLFQNIFGIGDKAQNKCIPTSIFDYTEDFALGILEGLIDSDGTVKKDSNTIYIRLSSRYAIQQISMLIRMLGFTGGNTHSSVPFSCNKEVQQRYDIWGVQFTITDKSQKLINSIKAKDLQEKDKCLKYTKGWAKITDAKKLDYSSFIDDNCFIYDITTESNTFMCDGLWCHNCVSISMYPFLCNGLRGLGGQSDAPKHLEGFCGGFENLVFILASQFAGAVATVEFLLCFDYFARKDYGKDYLHTQERLIKDKLQAVVYKLNQPAGARSFQCPFWNISVFDENYFHALFDDFVFPDEDGTKPCWETLSKLQEFFLNWFNEERKRSLLTFPVVTATVLTKDGDVVDEKFVNMLSEQMSKGNSFFNYLSDSVDSLASCCRLRNALQEKNTFSFSLGAGGVSTGSMNVITLNANRLVQNADRQGIKWQDLLKDNLSKIYKYQMATKSYLTDLLNAHLLPAYDALFISMKKQYLTTGINGLLESAEYFGLTPGNNKEYIDYVQEFLKIIYDCDEQAKKEYKTLINLEFVPAENLGVKNYKWDKKDGYKVNPNRNCYNSYLYPVEASDEEVSVIDKFILHGGDTLKYLDGGSALHLNLGEYPTKKGYRKLYKLAAQTGCNYWTTNIPVTVCHDCGYINKQTHDHCTKCGSKNIGHAVRVIGYLREIDNFSKDRQIEATKRFYAQVNSDNIKLPEITTRDASKTE